MGSGPSPNQFQKSLLMLQKGASPLSDRQHVWLLLGLRNCVVWFLGWSVSIYSLSCFPVFFSISHFCRKYSPRLETSPSFWSFDSYILSPDDVFFGVWFNQKFEFFLFLFYDLSLCLVRNIFSLTMKFFNIFPKSLVQYEIFVYLVKYYGQKALHQPHSQW